jgi:hypothetical protein
VEIEILHIDGCPNSQEAGRRVRAALGALGDRAGVVGFRLVRSAADAAGTPFAGSPTIAVDGADLFPSAAGTGQPACRVYETPDGLRGVPTTEQLIDALAPLRRTR